MLKFVRPQLTSPFLSSSRARRGFDVRRSHEMWTVGFHTPWGIDAFHCTVLGLSILNRRGQTRTQAGAQGSEVINRDQPSKRREMAEVNAALLCTCRRPSVYMFVGSPLQAGRPVGTSDMQTSRPAKVDPNHGQACTDGSEYPQ